MISQREARRLKKRVAELEKAERDRCNAWVSDYPGGVRLDTINVGLSEWYIVATARRLGHAVVIVPDKEAYLRIYGVRLPAER